MICMDGEWRENQDGSRCHRSKHTGNPATAENFVVAVEHGSLARGDGRLGLKELNQDFSE